MAYDGLACDGLACDAGHAVAWRAMAFQNFLSMYNVLLFRPF